MSSTAPVPDTQATAPKAPDLRDEILYESDRTHVVRRRLPDGSTVILKRANRSEAARRLRHERSILERLAKVKGTSKLAEGSWSSDLLALQDSAGTPLSDRLASRGFTFDETLQLVSRLTRTIAAMHRAGVIHKDINPSNILLCGDYNQPVLIDFNIASSYSEERTSFTHEKHIVGTLAYMPPEQTGRTGQPVDHRADLYALGVLCHTLVAGRPMFDTVDMLDLLQHQLMTVPPRLVDVAPGVPPMFSALVQRLLEKEPDRRYQSAEGVAHDLERLALACANGQAEALFTLGERDFAAKLTPPSYLIGRAEEGAQLEAALQRATEGAAQCVLISGPTGVGKTALVNALRGKLAALDGWFISGKCEPQHRHDGMTESSQAMRVLGKLLLSEPEEALIEHRKNLVAALGANISAGITSLPEFELLLGAQSTSISEPQEAEKRMFQGTLDALGCIASQQRPVVMFLDDMQWSVDVSARFLDVLMAARDQLPGLLVVMAYRPDALREGSLLASRIERWKQLPSPPLELALSNLQPAGIGQLVGDMLRLAPEPAMRLSGVLSERAQGNPQATIELINALRLDGLLLPGETEWRWDEKAIRRYVGDNDGVDLLARRIDALPAAALALMQTLALLGGEVSQSLLEASSDPSLRPTLDALMPALEDGLLVSENSRNSMMLQVRNNRVQDCLHASMGDKVPAFRLALSRRLAAHESYSWQASRQYLNVVEQISEPDERRRVAQMLHDAARAQNASDFELCDRFIAAAIYLLTPIETPSDAPLMFALLEHRHLTLYGLGRHTEGDDVYASIATRCVSPLALAVATGVQCHSLTNRLKFREACQLGLNVLSQLGLPKPEDLPSAIGVGLRRLASWAACDKRADFDRPEATDPHVKGTALLLKRTLISTFFEDKQAYSWLLLEVHRLWVEHGPCVELMSGAASFPILLLSVLKDYRGAYMVGRHVVEVGEHRGYEHGAAMARTLGSMCTSHWGDPLEEGVAEARKARVGLLKASDIQYAGYTFGIVATTLTETGRTLDEAFAENTASIAFEEASGNPSNRGVTLVYQQFVNTMRGHTHRLGSFESDDFKATDILERFGKVQTVHAMLHAWRAIASLIFNDKTALCEHSAAAQPWLPVTPGFYSVVLTYLAKSLAAAAQLHDASGDAREALLAQLDDGRSWMNDRATDAPVNFRHLVWLIDAERAWALGEMEQAAAAFEAAMAEVEHTQRPWHHAYINERAGRFYLARGWTRTARPFLIEALRAFGAWGANGKVTALQEEFSFLRTLNVVRGSTLGATLTNSGTLVSSDMVDTMAILRASQALSSETSLPQLNTSMAKVLSSICGAESVQVIVRPKEMPGWYLATSLEDGADPMTVEQAASAGLLPLSAFRYAERTREPLLVEDAKRDHRFASDPAFAQVEHCSLLLVPILRLNEIRAVLVLSNQKRHSAFSADRLDSVKLIAGQLAVSLDNALLYASLERRVAQRTAELESTNRKLEQLSVTDGLTGLSNRRHFNEVLALEWARAERMGTSIGLAMIDIDQFKQYNDHYGHHGGDACLKLVADAMSAELRTGDLIARYGGEEFVLLLRDADIYGTYALAERIRAAVASKLEPHVTSGHGIVTISVGIASIAPSSKTSAAECLATADAALYDAKHAGRNRVSGQDSRQEALS